MELKGRPSPSPERKSVSPSSSPLNRSMSLQLPSPTRDLEPRISAPVSASETLAHSHIEELQRLRVRMSTYTPPVVDPDEEAPLEEDENVSVSEEQQNRIEECMSLSHPDLSTGLVFANHVEYARSMFLQSSAGAETAAHISSFFSSLAEIERSYAQAVHDLVAREAGSLRVEDRMQSTWSGWAGVLGSVAKSAEAHERLAQRIGTEICGPLSSMVSKSVVVVKTVLKDLDEFDLTMAQYRSKVRKMRKKVLAACEEAQSEKAGKKQFKKAHKQCVQYNKIIQDGNKYLESFKTYQLPLLMSKIQESEETRIQATKVMSQHYAGCSKQSTEAILMMEKEIVALSDAIECTQDIQGFIESLHHSSMASPQLLEPLVYDMPLSLFQLENRIEKGPNYKPVDLKADLDEIVAQQRIMFSSCHDLDVPRIFLALLHAMVDTNAFMAEGIFRKGGQFTHVNQLYDSINDGNYAIPSNTGPHVLSNVLKKWLRELRHPLFPTEDLQTHVIALSEGNEAITPEQAASILEAQPLAYQLVTQGIIWMIRRIASPDHVSSSKMTVSNLAIIFSPIFLAAPPHVTDANRIIQLSKYGQFIVEQLADHVPCHTFEALFSKRVSK